MTNNLTPGVRNVMHCHTAPGDACTQHGAGHAMLPLQERVTAATPSKWLDGIVRDVSAGGWLAVDLLDGNETLWLWHHADLTASVASGQPVAVHALYHALAVGPDRYNVLVASIS
jgi:hypothetical protein